MSPDAETTKMLQELLRGQQATAIAVARVEEILTGHIDRQRERTQRRDERCGRSESRTGALEDAVSRLALARAGDSGGRMSRAVMAQWAAQVATLAIACWATLKPR